MTRRTGIWVALLAISAAAGWYGRAPRTMPERADYLCLPFARAVAFGTGLQAAMQYEVLPFRSAWLVAPRRECARFLLQWAADARE